jgi:hypothetical protein
MTSPRRPNHGGRQWRFNRYWVVGLAASAALFIAVMLLPGQSSAALFDKAIEKFSRFDTLKMEVASLGNGQLREEGMLFFRGNRWSHFAKNHARRGDPDPVAVPFIAAAINDLDSGKSLIIDFSTQTWWLDNFQPAASIPNRLANFARVQDNVVKHVGQEVLGDTPTEVYEVQVDELLGRLNEAKVMVWVDPRTELPVQIRSDETYRDSRGVWVETTLYRNIEWNPPLEERFFSLTPPTGFQQTAPRSAQPYDPNSPPPPEHNGK